MVEAYVSGEPKLAPLVGHEKAHINFKEEPLLSYGENKAFN
jgi:hypothetical protein